VAEFTALDEYYQNGPLPTWIGWHLQHFRIGSMRRLRFGTLALELALVWICFCRGAFESCASYPDAWQIGIILSANYTFLNYLVLALGIFAAR